MKRILIAALAAMLTVAAVAPFAPVAHAQDPSSTTLFITDNGRVSIEIPDGWFASGNDKGVQTTNRAELLNQTELVLQPGDKLVAVVALARADIATFGVEADANLQDIANLLLPDLLTEVATVEEVSEVEYMGHTLIREAAHDGDKAITLYLYDNLAPGYISFQILVTPKDEFNEAVENEMLGIAMSVQYSLELDQTFTSSDGSLTLSFPTSYIAIEADSSSASIYDSVETQAAAEADEDTSLGQVRLLAFFADPTEWGEITDEILKLAAQDVMNQITADSKHNPVVNEPVTLDNEWLGPAAVVTATSDINGGGVVVLYDKATNRVAVVIYVDGLDVGNQLMLTALNIAHSMLYTQASS